MIILFKCHKQHKLVPAKKTNFCNWYKFSSDILFVWNKRAYFASFSECIHIKQKIFTPAQN